MGYHYSSRRFSYDSPEPEDLDSASVRELIDGIKDAIDAEKLKDTKSYLSKLKLAINREFPAWTETLATFSAYAYAKSVGKKKVVDSLHKAMIKKNYAFDGLSLYKMIDLVTKENFKIIVDDYLSNKDSKWQIEGPLTLEKLYNEYPKETEQFIFDGRLNKFEKGETRVETTLKVIKLAKTDKAIITTLNTFFGMDYVQQYGINHNKMDILLETLYTRPQSMQKTIIDEYFYLVALKDVTYEMVITHFEKGLLTDKNIQNWTLLFFRKKPKQLIEVLGYIKNDELRTKMVTFNDEILNLVTQEKPELLPKAITDLFLF